MILSKNLRCLSVAKHLERKLMWNSVACASWEMALGDFYLESFIFCVVDFKHCVIVVAKSILEWRLLIGVPSNFMLCGLYVVL